MAVFDEAFEEIEDLRGDGNRLSSPTQLAAVSIERKVCEAIEQIAVLRPKQPSGGHVSTSTAKEKNYGKEK